MKRDTSPARAPDTLVAPAAAPTRRLDSPPLRPRRHRRARRGWGLATKYFVLAASVIVLTLGTATWIAAHRAAVIADREVRSALARVEHVFAGFQAERAARSIATVRSCADAAGTRALLASGVSPATVQVWAQDNARILGAEFVTVLDPDGVIVARSDRSIEDVGSRSMAHARAVQEALGGKESAALAREGARLFTIAAVPVRSGEGAVARLEGIIVAGYPLAESAVQQLSTLSGSDATFVALERADHPVPVASTLAAGGGEALLTGLRTVPEFAPAVLQAGHGFGPVEVGDGDARMVVLALPLQTGSGAVIGAFLASRSLAEARQAFEEIRRTLLLVGSLALLVAIPISHLFARRIARPLMELTASAHAVREGRLDVVIPAAGHDEVGQLAASFARMVAELREKAALEQLVMDLGAVRAATPEPVLAAAAATGAAALSGYAGRGLRLETGTTLGQRFQLVSLLGEGGMGTVWRARDLMLGEDVAIKVIRNPALAADPAWGGRLKDEMRLSRRVTHPNILRTHDLGEVGGMPFISMEYVPGITLRRAIDERGPLPFAAGMQIMRQICRGLSAAHAAGIVHRDIKPQNVIIAPNGQVKIMDFGIACTHEREGVHAQRAIEGTPQYMSPEQLSGEPPDARADIYAVGVLLYETFVGSLPFDGVGDTLEVLVQNVLEPLPSACARRSDLPPALDAVIAKATAKRPADRVQTADELLSLLEDISA